jgi:hypothetical protein
MLYIPKKTSHNLIEEPKSYVTQASDNRSSKPKCHKPSRQSEGFPPAQQGLVQDINWVGQRATQRSNTSAPPSRLVLCSSNKDDREDDCKAGYLEQAIFDRPINVWSKHSHKRDGQDPHRS